VLFALSHWRITDIPCSIGNKIHPLHVSPRACAVPTSPGVFGKDVPIIHVTYSMIVCGKHRQRKQHNDCVEGGF
jgi:hypothetical protein